jgi:hypothetical protein
MPFKAKGNILKSLRFIKIQRSRKGLTPPLTEIVNEILPARHSKKEPCRKLSVYRAEDRRR